MSLKTLRSSFFLGLTVVVALLGPPGSASAHGLIGQRFFPATLMLDDPFVADELSLPTVTRSRTPGSGDKPAQWDTSVSAEFSKRLSRDFGFSLGGTWKSVSPDNDKSVSGFDNLEVALKYVFFKSPEHETLVSAGLGWDVGGTGSRKVDAERFDTVTPALFFGKGFGDLPDSVELLKPLALTGSFGVSMPTRHATKTHSTDPDTGEDVINREVNGSAAKWGLSVQYNLQYLQSVVRDVGLPQPFRRMIPIIEFALKTPLDDPKTAGRTTGTVNPGIIWFGRYVQIGLEALIPVNERSGKNIGVIGQLHFYLDDILPSVFTWTPFQGVLGPTQPR